MIGSRKSRVVLPPLLSWVHFICPAEKFYKPDPVIVKFMPESPPAGAVQPQVVLQPQNPAPVPSVSGAPQPGPVSGTSG